MNEHPIRHVYTAPMGPVKSRLIIMGIPVRSHETRLYSGNGISKGGPGIISKTPDSPASMLASTSFLVSNLCNYFSPVEKKIVYAK